jgi:hypothetical protein
MNEFTKSAIPGKGVVLFLATSWGKIQVKRNERQELGKNFHLQLSVPARRELENKGINALKALAGLLHKEPIELYVWGKVRYLNWWKP